MAKKRHIGLWITLGIVFTLVVAPIATFYICFYDSTTASFEGDDSINQQEVFTDLAVDSLDYAKDEHKISYQISQDNLNQLLYTASKSFPEDAKSHLKKMTVEIDDDTYHFYFDMTFPLMQTRLDISCGLTEIQDALNSDNDTFVFSIKDIKLGRISGLDNLIFSIAGNFVSDQDIENSLHNAGLNMEVSFSNKTITYNKKQALEDLEGLINPSNETGLYFTILQDFLDSGLLTFDFNSNARISGDVDLTSLHTNATYCTPHKELGIDIGAYRDDLKTLLDHGIIDDEESDQANAFDYLIRGYENSSAEAKTYMAGKDLSSISITDYASYAGSDLHYVKDVDEAVKDQINLPDIALGKIAHLGEDEINDVIKTTDVFGYSYLLSREEQDVFKVNYITIDNFYCNIVDDHLYLVIGVNINGYETSIALDAIPSSMSQYSLELSTNKVFYGTHEASSTLKDLFFSLVSKSVEDEGWMSFDKTTGNIVIDFSDAVESSGFKAAIDARGTVQMALKGGALSDEGYFDITVA